MFFVVGKCLGFDGVDHSEHKYERIAVLGTVMDANDANGR